jgi:hypothetical protein
MKRLNSDASRLAAANLACGRNRYHRLFAARPRSRDGAGLGVCCAFPSLRCLLSAAREVCRQWTFPGGAADNQPFLVRRSALILRNYDETEQMLLFDPQTSGGLLLAVPAEKLEAFLARAVEIDQPAWVVGEVREGIRVGSRAIAGQPPGGDR